MCCADAVGLTGRGLNLHGSAFPSVHGFFWGQYIVVFVAFSIPVIVTATTACQTQTSQHLSVGCTATSTSCWSMWHVSISHVHLGPVPSHTRRAVRVNMRRADVRLLSTRVDRMLIANPMLCPINVFQASISARWC